MAYKQKSYFDPNAPKKRSWNPNWKKQSNIIPGSQYRPVSSPSAEQQSIFDAVIDGNDNVMISAYAGCGKTTACVEAMHRVQKKYPHRSQGYIIFAKRNQEEAVGKCPVSATVKTTHSFGLAALSKAYGKIQIDKEKTDRIAFALVGADEEKAELRYMLAKAIDLGKDYLANSSDDIIPILEKHGIETCGLSESEFAEKAIEGMNVSLKQPNIVSFSDMIFLPIKLGINIDTFNYLYGDEIQDLNPARIELTFRMLGNKGRLISVGDENQAIFGFSGADRYAMKKIKDRANATNLPLFTTYRCGKKIVELAKQYVPDYIAAKSNPDGKVENCNEDFMIENAAPGDFILSRTNALLAKYAMKFLKEGRKCNIQGKDLGNELAFMIKRSGTKDVASFSEWLEDWASAEIERLSAKKKSYEHITDKKDCLDAFCEGERDIKTVKQKILDMFNSNESDEEHRIILSTIHRSKGLERNRVFQLEKSFTVKAKTEEEQIAERNIRYVGITRAKNELYLVE